MTKFAFVIVGVFFFLPAEIWAASNVFPFETFLLSLSLIQICAK